MKNYIKKTLLIGAAFGIASLAQATDITLSTPSTLYGNNAYAIGVNLNVPTGQQITDFTISFDNVQLKSAPDGYLYIDLLDLNTRGTQTFWDGDQRGDYFASKLNNGQGIALKTQVFTWWNQTLNTTISFNADELAALNTYADDGTVAIGLDPDCRFYFPNSYCHISYNCNPTPPSPPSVPDTGMTAALLGMSFAGLMLFRRKLVLN